MIQETADARSRRHGRAARWAVLVSLAVAVGIPARGIAQDVNAGRALAERSTVDGHVGCSACHLMSGAGQPEAGIPRLAGVAAGYIENQLTFFASDKRKNQWMVPYAKALTPQQIKDVAAYFAAQPAPDKDSAPAPAPQDLLTRGEEIFKTGIKGTSTMACMGCHGPAGLGMGAFAPPLAGQSAAYVLEQLRIWNSGDQRDPMGKMMQGEVKGMSDHDMQAVAAFVSNLPADPNAGAAK